MLAELALEHYRYSTYEYSSFIILLQYLLDSPASLASLIVKLIFIIQLLLGHDDVCVEFTSIGEVAHPGFMGEHWHILVILLSDSWVG